MKICCRLRDLFSFPGFVARAVFKQAADGSNVRVVRLRGQKNGHEPVCYPICRTFCSDQLWSFTPTWTRHSG